MINTYLDIHLKDEDNKKKIDKVFFCTNEDKVEVDPEDALCNNTDDKGKPKYIDFTFSNLCYNYPYRIIISGECCPPSSEYEWYNGAHFSLMYAYNRLTQMLGSRLTPRIDYDTEMYSQYIYKFLSLNGIENLYTLSLYPTPELDGGEVYPSPPSKFLLFPLVFQKKKYINSSYSDQECYYLYNPPVGFSKNVGFSFYENTIDSYFEVISCKGFNQEHFIQTSDYKIPVFGINEGNQIWNIDLGKLNIGNGVSRFYESY